MKRLTIFSLTCLFSMGAVFAQQGVTQCGVPTGQPKFPLLTYQELPDPTAPSDKEWAAVTYHFKRLAWRTCERASCCVDRRRTERPEFQLW